MKCITPFTKRMGTSTQYDIINLPCGKCVPCLKGRISSWQIRLKEHEKRCNTAYFITLTYDPNHVHITKNGFMSLSPFRHEMNKNGKVVNIGNDITQYMKRIRKEHDKMKHIEGWKPLKYYAVGEYGGKTKRPHYHAIIFNVSEYLIKKQWKHGFCHVGNVTAKSVAYTLKYISKDSQVPCHDRDDRVKETSQMSKGLGLDYLTEEMTAWHHADVPNRVYYPDADIKRSLPKYYKKRIYNGLQWAEYLEKVKPFIEEENAKLEALTDQERYNIVQNHIAQYHNYKLNSRKNEKI